MLNETAVSLNNPPPETGYKRNRRFRFGPYLALFEEPEESGEGAPQRPRARRQ